MLKPNSLSDAMGMANLVEKPKKLARMGGSLLSKAEVPGSSLPGHLPKEFSLRLTWCPWLVGYYGTREISRGARKLTRTPSLSKKKKILVEKKIYATKLPRSTPFL